MHATQLGEIDSKVVLEGRPFEIKVSETGINTDEAFAIAQVIADNGKDADAVAIIGGIVALFQMGPKTGNPVFSDTYSDDLFHHIREACPSGNISGLRSIRETAKYPIVSGEVVKIVGYCEEG